jgi:3-deoxy-D-manno-octulosonate 8-phosphate phosphatase (KDO 8-P phosphatase)
MGISLALKAGIAVALISGEDSPLIDRYAAKMRITDVWKGSKQKARALEEFAERRGFDLSAICFMGDDVNDLEAMRIAGMSAAPCNARPAVLESVSFISTCPGGNGAVRELIDKILAK